MTTVRRVRLNLALSKALKGSRREADASIRSGYAKVDERRRVVTGLGANNNKVGRHHGDDDGDDGGAVGRDFGRFRGPRQHPNHHRHGAPALAHRGRNGEIANRGETETAQDRYGTILYHKPVGVVSFKPDPGRGQVHVSQMCTSDREYRPPVASSTSSSSSASLHDNDEDDDEDEAHHDDAEGRAWYEPSRQQHSPARLVRGSPRTMKETNQGRVPPPPPERFGWAVAGHLERMATGLLVLTTSAALKAQILGYHPLPGRSHSRAGDLRSVEDPQVPLLPPLPPLPMIEKEYLARIPQLASEPPHVVEDKLNQLRRGVRSERDWTYDSKVSAAGDQNDDKKKEEEEEEGDALEMLTALRVRPLSGNRVQFVLDKVRRLHVRRMCHAVGWDVKLLERVRIGKVRLDDLPYGSWRYLNPDETFLWPQQVQELEQEL